MFFYASKIFWIVAAPSNIILLLAGLAFLALMFRRWRLGRGLLFLSLALAFLGGILPMSVWLLRPLEDRFPRPDLTGKQVAGIIVLGGAVNPDITRLRGPVQLSSSGSRMTEAVALALRFPKARLVFTGGSAKLVNPVIKEASAAEQFFLSLGLSADRFVLERNSRNTYENAVYTKALVKLKAGETWVLVTSAFHMPRSVGIFRKIGFDVVPYPSDYRTRGTTKELWNPVRQFSEGILATDIAVREWIGLVAYYWVGRTSVLFPAPKK